MTERKWLETRAGIGFPADLRIKFAPVFSIHCQGGNAKLFRTQAFSNPVEFDGIKLEIVEAPLCNDLQAALLNQMEKF